VTVIERGEEGGLNHSGARLILSTVLKGGVVVLLRAAQAFLNYPQQKKGKKKGVGVALCPPILRTRGKKKKKEKKGHGTLAMII